MTDCLPTSDPRGKSFATATPEGAGNGLSCICMGQQTVTTCSSLTSMNYCFLKIVYLESFLFHLVALGVNVSECVNLDCIKYPETWGEK